MKKGIFSFLFLVAILVAYFFINSNNTGNVIINDLNVTHVGETRLYPNYSLTPGDVLTTNASIVCVSGYSASVRDVPLSERKEVYKEYNVDYPQPMGYYEVDHFISLELGGSNDIKNLWLEPAEPRPGFHEKDKVENYLHDQVCSGKMSLEEAQKEIATDWYKVYLSII